MDLDTFFQHHVPEKLQELRQQHADLAGRIRLDIQTSEGVRIWVVDLKEGTVEEGDAPADTRIQLDADTLLGLAEKRIQPFQAFFTGKLRVSGNMDLALRLSRYLF